jgi:hypothetical protein
LNNGNDTKVRNNPNIQMVVYKPVVKQEKNHKHVQNSCEDANDVECFVRKDLWCCKRDEVVEEYRDRKKNTKKYQRTKQKKPMRPHKGDKMFTDFSIGDVFFFKHT